MSATGTSRCALLDVNVLVALTWPNHVHHEQARRWFDRRRGGGWATTPVSEAGFVRVSSNRAAIATATTPALARELLTRLTGLAGHEFWTDDVRHVTGVRLDPSLVVSYQDVTDAHLLALADRHRGRLVTFDARISRLLGGLDNDLLEVLEVSPGAAPA